MAAILGLDRESLEDICQAVCDAYGAYVGIANDNCPGQIVISGEVGPLEQAMAMAKEAGARRTVRLAVSIAAHSPLMAQAAESFKMMLAEIPMRPPRVPFVANATATAVDDPDAIREVLGLQLTSPVRWTDSIRFMVDGGVDTFIEVGPKDVLVGLVRRVNDSVGRLTTEQALARCA
jgi:[acyl-carrier-protein] S-malonyltransferase